MEITNVTLYTANEGNTGESSAEDEESQYWGGGWAVKKLIANPMSIYDEYKSQRTAWMGPGQDPFVVELETDTDVTGFCANYGGGRYACDVIDTHFRRFIEDANPFNVERIWEQMYRSTLPYGQRGITMMAISAVDLALYDLLGKITDQPVYNLLGGKTKDAIPCYVTTHVGAVDAMVDEGFLGVKVAQPWGPADGHEGLIKTEEMVAAMREELGPEPEIMLDCYMAWDREFTIRAADRIKQYDVKWIEDPLHPGAITEYREIVENLKPIQTAVGNLEFGHKAYHQFLNAGAGDIIQPELRWAGGLTEVQRIAGMAKGHGLPVIPHGSSIYNYHFVISHTNAPHAEFLMVDDGREVRPVFDLIEGEPLPEDGVIEPSDNPGFGVDLNRDLIEPYGTA